MKRVILIVVLTMMAMGCGGGSGDAQPDTAQPDTAEADTAEPDTTEPDTSGPLCPEPGTTVRPNGRSEAFGVMDPVRRRLVFFGGDDGAPVNCNPNPHLVGGTWIYDTVCAVFEEVTTNGDPGPRSRGASVYDPVNDRMVIFGGRTRTGNSGPYTLFDDVWALDLETLTWEKLEISGTKPLARYNPAGGYNALTHEMIIFGGTKGTSGMNYEPLADTGRSTWTPSRGDRSRAPTIPQPGSSTRPPWTRTTTACTSTVGPALSLPRSSVICGPWIWQPVSGNSSMGAVRVRPSAGFGRPSPGTRWVDAC